MAGEIHNNPADLLSGKAGAAVKVGVCVKYTTSYDGVTDTVIKCESGIGAGVSLGVKVGTVYTSQETYAAGDEIAWVKPGGEVLAFCTGAVVSLAIPLKPTTDGAFTPCITDKDAYMLWPLATGSANTYIRCIVMPGYYAV
jgi:hypothetical protein